MKKRYNSNYLGIVVQNNDTEKRGRVKVWVPHVSMTLYPKWNKTFQQLKDKHFIFPDLDTNPDLVNILQELKESLPWAETALPIMGGGASGRYNAWLQKGSTSDSNYWSGATQVKGYRPSQNYVNENRVSDAFTETGAVGNKLVNPHSFNYTPSDYSNMPRGQFSIPNVGAHVWVFFVDGDPNYPVIWAVSYGQEDWKRIYSMNRTPGKEDRDFNATDYPSSYENLSKDDQSFIDHNIQTFRAKTVFNSNKNTIELVDTDLSEMLKMTHFSGSFLEFNNFTTSMFSTNNDQKLVTGDQFNTVRKNQAMFVGGNQENIVIGDRITNLGDFNKRASLTQKIYDKLKTVHDKKRLFETQRALPNTTHTGSKQLRVGTPGPCPVCQGAGIKFLLPCQTCYGTGLSPSTQDGIYALEPEKWIMVAKPYEWFNDLTRSWTTGGAGLIWDPVNKLWKNPLIIPNFNTTDDSTVQVPQQEWKEVLPVPEPWVAPLLSHDIRQCQRDIMEYEAMFGNGGDEVVTITNNKVEMIGTVFNDLPSYRIDPVGKIRNSRTYISLMGTYVAMQETPLVEYVDVDNVPGGDYNLTVCNKYTMTVGSKGIKIKTTGPLDMYGTIVNMVGESVNISSKNEVIIDGGERLELRASVINIKPKMESDPELGATMVPRTADQYIMLDGNVGVKGNTTFVGGAHHEGEVYLHHITAPDFRYQTDLGLAEMPHSHTFHAPPWDLLLDLLPATVQSMEVRREAGHLNNTIPVPNMYAPGFWVPS